MDLKKAFLLCLLIVGTLAGCKHKRTSLNDEDEVQIGDFIEFFQTKELPYRLADTALVKIPADTGKIGYKVFTRFVPDSVLKQDFGKVKPVLYPLGRIETDGDGNYLVVRAAHNRQRVGYLLYFNDKDEYGGALRLLRTGFESNSATWAQMGDDFGITTYREYTRKGVNGSLYKRDVYMHEAGTTDFRMILTESNDEQSRRVINPIDTLPVKNARSGDYVQDDRNFISIRDGRTKNEFQFFIHFEKDGGNCSGELKGRARMVSETKALYKEPDNPCALQFTFTKTSVSINEEQGCGTYRGIRCLFEGKFPKKKKTTDKK